MKQYSGDALAQLLQVQAHAVEVELKSLGTGLQDVHTLLLRLYNSELARAEYVKVLADIMEEMKKPEWPEPIQAFIYSRVLAARANCDLKVKT